MDLERDRKDMKKVLRTLSLFILALLVASYATLTYRNNQSVPTPDRARIQAAYNAAAAWISEREAAVLDDANPALWWMVQKSAALTGDATLTALFERYRQKHLQGGRNIWEPLFFPSRWVPFKSEDIAHYGDYQLHFMYAISCDSDLAQLPIIQAQLNADYCDKYPWRPACATHQLMGLRFMQTRQCGDAAATQTAITALQQRIVRQLTWDPRVVDVYMQRVLMLAESGRADAIKAIWLERLLNAQRPDGGWSGTEAFVPLPMGASFGFSARGFTLKPPTDDFHMTAQGLLLMSLLLEPNSSPK